MPTFPDIELEHLRSFTADALPSFLADLERLVNVDCGTYTKVGVDEIGVWFAEQLVELGAQVSVEHNETLGDSVVGVFEGEATGSHALLIGHLDTVFAD